MKAKQNKSKDARNLWAEVLEKIHAAKEQLAIQSNEECWYRGQSSTDPLHPSLFRLIGKGFNTKDDDPKSIYQLEYDLYFEFAYRGPGMQDAGLSGWDKLFCMRHYGLPTRLLDWSERLGVALFFALKSFHSSPPAIWILNPYLLNLHVNGDRDLDAPKYIYIEKNESWDYEDFLIFNKGEFKWDGPVAIYPEQKNTRMRSQFGFFTLFGEDTRSLEKQFPPARHPDLIQKIVIPHAAIPAAREFLSDAGIDDATIFPDLDGYSRYLKARYSVPGG